MMYTCKTVELLDRAHSPCADCDGLCTLRVRQLLSRYTKRVLGTYSEISPRGPLVLVQSECRQYVSGMPPLDETVQNSQRAIAPRCTQFTVDADASALCPTTLKTVGLWRNTWCHTGVTDLEESTDICTGIRIHVLGG